MSYYTATIPPTLAEKLKEKGMPIKEQPLYAQVAPNARGIVKAGVGLRCPSYAEVFDWLIGEGIHIRIIPCREVKKLYGTQWVWSWFINKITQPSTNSDNYWMNWHEAANAAIEKALELI